MTAQGALPLLLADRLEADHEADVLVDPALAVAHAELAAPDRAAGDADRAALVEKGLAPGLVEPHLRG
jgi:hypothetical protein